MRPVRKTTASGSLMDASRAPGARDLSILIVSFNTRDLLERTIRAALADSASLSAEIIVVDNASTDGSIAMVREKFPSVRQSVNPANRFYSAANNQAAALSRGRYLLILNSDVEIQPGTLPAMVEYLASHPDVGLATPKMMFPGGRVQQNCARFSSFESLVLEYTFWGKVRRRRRRQIHDADWYAGWDRLTKREIDVAPGSFLLVRREVFAAAGGFDERLRLYFAEEDLCRRIRQSGLKIVYLPVGGGIHPESASVEKIKWLARRIYFEDMIRFADKYYGSWRARWLWLLTRPTYWWITLAEKLRGAVSRNGPSGEPR
jgi:GT2 family glycosyltransferase